MSRFNPEITKHNKIYSQKVKMIEHLCADMSKLEKLIDVLESFNIPLSRYV